METDVVVFVSHRWWGAGARTPDDARGTKFLLVREGVRAIIAKHALSPERVAIWVDYASIDQDDAALMRAGIASLIVYAARSSFVLIPVEPSIEALYALSIATHPIELLNFGERAWCRLESYTVFLCLSRVTRRPAYAYWGTPTPTRACTRTRRRRRQAAAAVAQASGARRRRAAATASRAAWPRRCGASR